MGNHVFRIPLCWREPIDITIPCQSRVRKWAFENAPLLIAIMVAFFINLAITIGIGIATWVHGG